jgi:hypothetical protein
LTDVDESQLIVDDEAAKNNPARTANVNFIIFWFVFYN